MFLTNPVDSAPLFMYFLILNFTVFFSNVISLAKFWDLLCR